MAANHDRVIVCGGGLAGLSAALSAQQAGVRVLLVDKAPELGGTTKLSGGLLWTFADYEEARAKIPKGDAALQWLVFDTIDASRAWLGECGVKIGAIERVLGHGMGASIDPAEAVAILERKFRTAGGEVLAACGMQSLLLSDDGTIRGVRTLRGARLEELSGRAVVLATGGFQGNQELLERYAVPDAANLALRANRWSTGDGLIAAMNIGAGVSSGLGTFYGHALAAAPARYASTQLRDASQYHGAISVALNLRGERFTDETADTGEEALNQALAQQPEGRGVYIVDEDDMELTPIQGRPSITRTILERARAMGGTVIEEANIDRLCIALGKVGFVAEGARVSLHAFNDAMRSGRADDLLPGRQRHRKPLESPPLRAVVVQAAITFTMGGLLIDETARVLWRAGSSAPSGPVPVDRAYADLAASETIAIGSDYRQAPIRGLFAAGNDVGNVSHFGYMGGLSTALTTGRVAGAAAAALMSS